MNIGRIKLGRQYNLSFKEYNFVENTEDERVIKCIVVAVDQDDTEYNLVVELLDNKDLGWYKDDGFHNSILDGYKHAKDAKFLWCNANDIISDNHDLTPVAQIIKSL